MSVKGWYKRKLGWVPKPVRQVIILVIGGTVLLLVPLGILLPILPGWIFLPIALAILGLEFAWAIRWLHKIKSGASYMHSRMKSGLGMGGDQTPKENGEPNPRLGAPTTPRAAGHATLN